MEFESWTRSGLIATDIFIIVVTAINLIFLTRYHRYIAWRHTEPDGSVTRLSLLTQDYFRWVRIPVTASILIIITSIVMIIYDGYWFRQIALTSFSVIGIIVTSSLVSIFPFDFSVIPNPARARVVQKLVRAFFIFMVVFYSGTVIVHIVLMVQ